MPFFRVLVILAVSSVAMTGGTYAGPASGAASPKAQKPTAIVKEALPSVVAKESSPPGQAAEEAPIVMGRSVGVVRKSKLHHIKVKPTHPGLPNKN